jgi:O-antigen/teichoic acid export membrane protein
LFRGALKLHPNHVGGFLISSANILVINHYLGPAETGQYQTAQQIVSLLLVIPHGASMIMYGQVAQLGPARAWLHQRSTVAILVVTALGAASIVAIAAPLGVPLVLGDGFAPAAGVSQILLLGVIGMTLATAMSSQWIGRGLFSSLSSLTIALGGLNVIANLVFVPRYGIHGAAWTWVGTYALAALAQGCLILKCEAERRSVRSVSLNALNRVND